MLNKKKILFLIPVIAVTFFAYTVVQQSEKEEAIDQLLIQSISSSHYQPKDINDAFAEKVFKLYIQRLDYNKKFFTEDDIDDLKKMQHAIDEEINTGKFIFFNNSFELINKRLEEAQEYYREILKKPFDFTTDESIELDAEKVNFSKSKKDLKESWKKSLKYQTLVKMVEMQESQQKAKEKSDTVKIKSLVELEIDARKKVLKNNDDWFKRLKNLDRNDRTSLYFNAITSIYDPHTEYYAPKDKANFDIGMSGQLEGIGAQLQEKDGFIRVSNIVPGSASWRQGQLKTGDIIMKVAQGSAEPVDITDMQLDDAVQLIRGKKGTEVRLTVKKPDASIVVITLIRDIVVMEETFAKSVILKGEKKLGYIKLPSFYADFNGKGGHSCAKDVKKEIEKLKEENVEGIILDLRNNGGGSLGDVVEMAGLFIEKGPIVQVKSKTGAAYVMDDKDPATIYDGPLTIMVNSNSASASEIMAAAIQDYKRGVIVGTSQSTFGKGTVQRFFDLDEYLPEKFGNLKPLGQVKITTQKFYRINGGATQLKGVTPDILIPDPYYLLDQGEKEQDYPIAWDEITPSTYKVWEQKYSIEKLKANSAARIQSDSLFISIEGTAKRLRKQKDSTIVSLNYDKYLIEKKQAEAEAKKAEKLDKEISKIEIIALKPTVPVIEGDTLKASKEKEWFKTIKKDLYLNETVLIMNEMK